MPPRRIFYLSRGYDRPAGGIRIGCRHVEMLCRNGFNAALLLTTGEHRFFPTTAPIQPLGDHFTYDPSDVFVIPEPWNDCLRLFQPTAARKVVFCQNHFLIPGGLGGARSYAELGVSTVLSCSGVIARHLTEIMGLDRAPVVHNGVDAAVFHPRPKRCQVAYMPRKMPLEAAHLHYAFRRRSRFADVPWVVIDGVPEAEAARVLGESAVFLSLSRLEGLGLPPLEAMAAGALVAGFHGDGGLEFATAENGLWCAGDDWDGCLHALDTALSRLDDPAAAARQRAAGYATARLFSLDRMERELLAFWHDELAR